VFTSTQRERETWPDWEFYPGPSSTLDEALMAAVEPSDVPLNELQNLF
jgi:hypothetical protein